MATLLKPSRVTGKLCHLSNGRLVYVGTDPEFPGHRYVATRNEDGQDTYLVFSNDALEALRSILNGELEAQPDEVFPHHVHWTSD